MAKYHVNNEGNPGPCGAEKGNCPFGGEEEHYSSFEDARMAYEQSMSQASVKKLSKQKLSTVASSHFISLLDRNGDVVREGTKDRMENLQPGVYSATLNTSADEKQVLLHVDEQGRLRYEVVKSFSPQVNPTSESVKQAFVETQEAFSKLRQSGTYFAENSIDQASFDEVASGFNRLLARYDFNVAEDVIRLREELDDMEWALEHDLELAKAKGDRAVADAIAKAKEPLKKLLQVID